MPEESTPPIDPSSADHPEWTDDSNFADEVKATTIPDVEVSDGSDDEWGQETLDWEDDYLASTNEPATPTSTKEAIAWLKPTWRKLRSAWQRILAGLRNRIPAAANLSDRVISLILIGILGLLLVILNSVRQPSSAVEKSLDGFSPEPTAISPSGQSALPKPKFTPAVSSSEVPTTAPTQAIDIERIGKIQAQLTDSSIYNASRVIDSVQADFTNNYLTLICNEDWFRLSNYDQTLLATQLMNQSTELSFQALHLQTPDGQLIARTPVIGNEMIIFLREKPPVVEPPERPRYRFTIDR